MAYNNGMMTSRLRVQIDSFYIFYILIFWNAGPLSCPCKQAVLIFHHHNSNKKEKYLNCAASELGYYDFISMRVR